MLLCIRSLAVVVALASLSAAAEAPPGLRLPPSVRPLQGEVALRVVPGEPSFSGTVDFRVEVAAAARVIWLHQHDLTITDASVAVGDERLPASPTTSGHFLGVV